MAVKTLNSHRFSLSLTAKILYMPLIIQSNRREFVVDIAIASDAYSALVLVLEYSFEVLVLVLVLVLEHTVLVAVWTFLQICAPL